MGWTNGNAENDELSLRKRAIIRLSTNTPSPASWEITQAPILNERKPSKCFPAILPTGDIHAKVLPCHREFGIGRSKRRGCGAMWQLVLLSAQFRPVTLSLGYSYPGNEPYSYTYRMYPLPILVLLLSGKHNIKTKAQG
jgi:hypothetical protein